MTTQDVDNVKLEKANAIARYRRFRNLAKLLKMVEVFVVLTLLSWSSTRLPTTVKTSAEYLLGLSVSLLNPHVVFLIGNAIVIALFVLSRQHDAGNDASRADLYEDYVRNSEAYRRIVTASDVQSPQPPPVPATEKTISDDDKQIVCSEHNAVSKTQCDAVVMAIEKATKQIQRFQRTQSEKLRREIAVRPGRELRRSETEVRQIVVTSTEKRLMTSVDTVDNLNNEEFRRRIEAFIAQQQRSLWAQKMAENEQ